MPAFSVLTGRRFGRFTVTCFAGHRGTRTAWLCRCDCGKDRTVIGNNLTRGKSRSCGCLNREVASAKSTTHGATRGGVRAGSTYYSWLAMKARCENPASHRYARYGGRGIRICERWRHSFEAFLQDMGERPASTTLDRIDPDGNYEPTNCRWATATRQYENRRARRDTMGRFV